MRGIKTISDALAQPEDNFLLLRFIAASMVIYGHASAISGGYAPTDIFVVLGWGEYSGSIALDLFFITSGFLVTGSFCRRQNVVHFVWARFIRIMPAFMTCLLLCALLIGPIFSIHALGSYLSDPETAGYVTANLRLGPYLSWDLPGVFLGNPKRTTINGSIWTLPAEIRMYVWVAMLGLTGVLRVRWIFNTALAGLFILGSLAPAYLPLVPVDAYVRLAALFALGGFCYINRSWIPIHGALVVAMIVTTYLFRSTSSYLCLFSVCEVLFVFWFAYNTPWRGFNRYGDYSYGIYLWGYPMQQMLAALFPLLPALINALLGFLGALAAAAGSWRFIEKPALGLKNVPIRLEAFVRNRIALARSR